MMAVKSPLFSSDGVTSSEMATLTRREREAIALLAEGYRYEGDCRYLGIGMRTIRRIRAQYLHQAA